mmetsp:Transcript_28147/g.75774  ORF Transcript_28147/g.75774 Transcript_28147/m.75774 type:complete len:475 (+) Transcript_28147:3106-4530(+)
MAAPARSANEGVVAQGDVGQVVTHLIGCEAAVHGVTVAELAEGVGAPALDAPLARERARVRGGGGDHLHAHGHEEAGGDVVGVRLVAHVEVLAHVHGAQVHEARGDARELVRVPPPELAVGVCAEALDARLLGCEHAREVEAHGHLVRVEEGRALGIVRGHAELGTVVLHATRRRRRRGRGRRRRGRRGRRGRLLPVVLVHHRVHHLGALPVAAARALRGARDEVAERVAALHGGAVRKLHEEVVVVHAKVVVPDFKDDGVALGKGLVTPEDEVGVEDGKLLVDVHLGHVRVVLVVVQLAHRVVARGVHDARLDVGVGLAIRAVDAVGEAEGAVHVDLRMPRGASAVLLQVSPHGEGLIEREALGRGAGIGRLLCRPRLLHREVRARLLERLVGEPALLKRFVASGHLRCGVHALGALAQLAATTEGRWWRRGRVGRRGRRRQRGRRAGGWGRIRRRRRHSTIARRRAERDAES